MTHCAVVVRRPTEEKNLDRKNSQKNQSRNPFGGTKPALKRIGTFTEAEGHFVANNET
jgi:hypothetical protein